MAGRSQPLPLSDCSGGINRIVRDAQPNQAVEGLNVTGDEGEARRRDGIASFAVGAGFNHPLGEVCIAVEHTEGAGGGPFVFANSATTMSISDVTMAIYIGHLYHEFDGIDFAVDAEVTLSGTWTQHVRLVLEYWNGSAWTAVPWFLDETLEIQDGYLQPLAKAGKIAWHRDLLTGWAETSVDSLSAHWVRLRFQLLSDLDIDAYLEGTRTLVSPMIRTFDSEPVNGLFPVRIEGQSGTVICTDRAEARAFERGAGLSIKRETFFSSKALRFVLDEGAAFWDVHEWPAWTGMAAGSDSGTAGRLTKIRTQYYDPFTNTFRPFVFIENQFLGGVITTSTGLPIVSGSLSEFEQYNHCRLRLLTSAAPPPAAGEEGEVYRGPDLGGNLSIFPDFTDAPDASDSLELRRPPCSVRIQPENRYYEVIANDAETISLRIDGDALPLARDADRINGSVQHYQVTQMPRWMIDAGQRWSGAVDPVTGRLLLVNGGAPLECDGQVLRKLRANYQSLAALAYVGALLDEQTPDAPDPSSIALSKLRTEPPSAKYITIYQNRIFLAGLAGRPWDIAYSAPGGLNNIWPLLFQTVLRDDQADPIVGMAVVGQRLLAFSPTAIHEAEAPSAEGYFSFVPISVGVGFVAHQAVAVVPYGGGAELLGVGPDAIYELRGTTPEPILDRFDRLLKGGVNQAQLHKASAVVTPQNNRAWFSVPAAGDTICRHLFEYDYQRKTWWVHYYPHGITTMAVDYDERGKETLIIGSDDGFLATFWPGLLTDDSVAVEGTMTTPFIQPLGGRAINPRALRVTGNVLGSQHSLTADVLHDDSVRAVHSGSLYFDKGQMTYGDQFFRDDGDTYPESLYQSARDTQTQDMRLAGMQPHRVAARITGTSLWSVRGIELEVAAGSPRGRQ